MSLLPVMPVQDEHVTIFASAITPTSALIEIVGELGHRDPGPLLDPFFGRLHQLMVDQGRSYLEIDITSLRFMNSSSFKHLVTLVKKNSELPKEQRYQMKFLINPAHHWQEISMNALSCFSQEAISIKPVAPKTRP